MFVIFICLAIGYVATVSMEDQTCPEVSQLPAKKCCYDLVDVINAERKQKECLKKQIKELKTKVNRQVLDFCSDYVVSTLLQGKRTVYSVSTTYTTTDPHCNCGPDRALLNSVPLDASGNQGGGWSAKTLDKTQYLQIDLLTSKNVVGVATQGRLCKGCDQWVTKYQVLYSNDCKTWTYIGGQYAQVFDGNVDQDTIKENMFENPVVAKYIRINPTEWYNHISMRADVIGCSVPANRA